MTDSLMKHERHFRIYINASHEYVVQQWSVERDEQNPAESRVLSFPLQGVTCVRDIIRRAVICRVPQRHGIDFRGLLPVHHCIPYVRTVWRTRCYIETIWRLHQALLHERYRQCAKLRLPLVHREATRAYFKVNWTLLLCIIIQDHKISNWISLVFSYVTF